MGNPELMGEGFVKKGGEVRCDTGGDGRFGLALNEGVGIDKFRGPDCIREALS